MPGYRHTITYTNGYDFDMTSLAGNAQEAEQIIWDHLTEDFCISCDVIQKIETVEVKE